MKWLTLCLLLTCATAQALPPVQMLDEGFLQLDPTATAEILWLDDDRDFSRIVADDSLPWQSATRDMNFGLTQKHLWMRFVLRREDTGPARIRLEAGHPLIDELDIHLLTGNVEQASFMLGDTRPTTNRPLSYRNFLVPVDLADNRPVTVYLHAHSLGSVQLPVTVWEFPAFIEHEQRELLALSFLYGAILSALLVFLFTAMNTRERGFGWFLLFLLGLTLYQGYIDGLIGQYLPVENRWWNQHNVAVIAILFTTVAVEYGIHFLHLRRSLPGLLSAMRVLQAVFLFGQLLALLILEQRMFPVIAVTAVVWGIASIVLGLYGIWRRIPRAGLYVVSMLLFTGGTTVSALERMGRLPAETLTHDAMLIAIFLQVVLLGFVIAGRIRQEMRERERAQEQALAARKRALATEWHLTYELEREVEHQTEALSQTMRDLQFAHRQLADMSRHDALTGLHNRRYFDEHYNELMQLASRQHQPLAVIMVDIDHFKRLNDSYGHAAGDECLRKVGAALRRAIERSTDLVARYGGEEFVIVLPNTPEAEARDVAERLRRTVEGLQIECDAQELHVTASLGLAVRVPVNGESGATLLAAADEALYRAKHNGRNRLEA